MRNTYSVLLMAPLQVDKYSETPAAVMESLGRDSFETPDFPVSMKKARAVLARLQLRRPELNRGCSALGARYTAAAA